MKLAQDFFACIYWKIHQSINKYNLDVILIICFHCPVYQMWKVETYGSQNESLFSRKHLIIAYAASQLSVMPFAKKNE